MAPRPATHGAVVDAHGYDPADYQWLPVLRRPRADGWTPQRQHDFIAALAETGIVEQAATSVEMSVKSCYRLRRAPGAEQFNAAWDAAMGHAARRLVDLAFHRVVNGVDEPVFDGHGNRIATRKRTNDRLLMFLLRAYMPERFTRGRDDEPGGPSRAALPPVLDALHRLAPVEPAEPHLLMEPDELDEQLEIADIMQGKLAERHTPPGDLLIDEPMPVDEAFERQLDAARSAPHRIIPGGLRKALRD